ncbi:hypothetical protein predicted by Glimmer/Critica [Acetobacter senegalensis]|uniref:Uncharacterized protein n=1 Tax=Acetobacter senegalensis TaxID=446692 RepID=A0A0U5ETP4_9PROT|nr:hypothetical protein predicted by Glimmer/Critica [Acetobacter senegalensis]
MRNWLKFHLGKRPWYWLRLDADNPWLLCARGIVEYAEWPENGQYVIRWRYYCRLRDFIQHVRQFGWPKLYR